MYIGIDCFKDIEICSMIESETRIGRCAITEKNNVLVYDTEMDKYLENYILEVLNIYTPVSELPIDFPVENLNNIEKILVDNWSFLNVSEKDAKTIIMEICNSIYSKDALIFNEQVGMGKLCDSEFLIKNSLVKDFTWDEFMCSIKNMNRFHSKHINLVVLEDIIKSPRMQIKILKNDIKLYRARICDDKGLTKRKMGPPPAKDTTAGRVNSSGISCLYLAKDIITTLHEIHVRDLDYVSIATFTAKKDLNVVDLSNLDKISPFSMESFDYEWFAINMSILKKISNEIAKPLRRQDSILDYLPSQYISDFVKSLGFDGLCYRSTLNKDGVNYTIFDHKKCKCNDVNLYHIKSLDYETEPELII